MVLLEKTEVAAKKWCVIFENVCCLEMKKYERK